MAPQEQRTPSGHDGGGPTLTGDRKVFLGEKGIGPASADVYSSKKQDGNPFG